MSAESVTETMVRPARRVRGRLEVPGDKSISHRYAMLGALAEGRTVIENYAPGADCAATLACLGALGVAIQGRAAPGGIGHGQEPAPTIRAIEIDGRGLRGLRRADAPLDAQNSGTTMRLMAGVLAAHPFETVLTGDDSLRRRPMWRVIEPLERMGARIESRDGRPPLTVVGAGLRGIVYRLPVPSAQVKSAILLAGLQASGRTTVFEPVPTRDHTELALAAFGARVDREAAAVSLDGGQRLRALRLRVPGDLSSAAFWAYAAAALPGSEIELAGVGLNPTRIGLLAVLRRAGARVDLTERRSAGGEPAGDVRVAYGELQPLEIAPDEVPSVIDELPVLAALGTYGGGMRVTGAAELRAKESDRITALVTGFRRMGADVDELPDGFEVRPTRRLAGGSADAAGDHRLAMAFAIAALGAEAPSVITGAEAVDVSYPGFFPILQSICE